MKYLGIDYGEKRVGIAVSNDDATIAFPRGALPQTAGLLNDVRKIIAEERIGRVVIGDTRTVSGAENPVTAAAEEFAEALARHSGVPVSRAYEAWSSIEASRYAPKGKEHDDAAAAAIILQRFLDMKRTK